MSSTATTTPAAAAAGSDGAAAEVLSLPSPQASQSPSTGAQAPNRRRPHRRTRSLSEEVASLSFRSLSLSAATSNGVVTDVHRKK